MAGLRDYFVRGVIVEVFRSGPVRSGPNDDDDDIGIVAALHTSTAIIIFDSISLSIVVSCRVVSRSVQFS